MSSPDSSDDNQQFARTWHPLSQQPPPVPFTGERSRFGVPPPTNTSRVGRTSHETIPRGPARIAAPQHPNLSTQAPWRGTYGVPRQQTHGARLCMLVLITTPTTPQDLGIQGIDNERSHRSSGTSPSPFSMTTTSSLSRSTPCPPTLPGRHWPSPGLSLGTIRPHTTSTSQTLLPLFGETRYPSLPREGTESHLSHSDSGLTSPTPVTAPQSPIEDDNDNEAPMLLVLSSRNPFLASIIAQQLTPSMWRGPTMSGTHSNRSTERSLDQNESRPGQTGSKGGLGRIWSTSSPPAGEHPSTSAPPQTGNSWQESMPTATGSYIAPTPAAHAQIYGHEQRRSIDSSETDSSPSRGDWTNDSIGRTTSEAFTYDWDSVFLGYRPEDAGWEDPQPLADSPLNPRRPGYYTGLMTSRLIAGAGEADMGDVADLWAGGAPAQLPDNPADRMDQLIQQVALLRNENRHLQDDITDLRQRAAQRGRPRAPAY